MSKLAKALTAAAGNAGGEAVYVEDVFSTYLYAGNSSTQTITNGIDLAGEGGMVWHKRRNGTGESHYVHDTERGTLQNIRTDQTNAESTGAGGLTSFNSDGFTYGYYQETGYNYASWTFRKAENFFDVVTWVGDGTSNRSISHSLGSTPGCIIQKRTDSGSNWVVWHRGVTTPTNPYFRLNTTMAADTYSANLTPTSTTFKVSTAGAVDDSMNENGATYVAYLFAHDAGGFGDDGTENVISCGSFSHTLGTSTTINLGWEPQWILYRPSNLVSNWYLFDAMRGWFVDSNGGRLYPNTTFAEGSASFYITNQGFTVSSGSDTANYIYIAIRRGPMKTPESGTEVFSPVLRAGTGASASVYAGFPVDMMAVHLTNTTNNQYVGDRLRNGGGYSLEFSGTAAESNRSAGGVTSMASMTGYTVGTYSDVNSSGNTYINWCFRRAPGFFDVVAYTGNSTAGHAIKHNLGVAPEFIVQKVRNNTTSSWYVYHKDLNVDGDGLAETDTMRLYLDSAAFDYPVWNDTAPTSTEFYLGAGSFYNATGYNYIAYLFGSVAGVSKVGSYTGTGSNVDVDCGFSAGARFILIKRTDSTGDWYVWDSVRGIVAGNDPYLLLNSTAAEVTSTDYIDPLASGFTVTSSAPAALNASGGTFIYLAIA